MHCHGLLGDSDTANFERVLMRQGRFERLIVYVNLCLGMDVNGL